MSNMQVRQKPKFSVAITTDTYQKLIANTLRDPGRAKRFVASISSAVAVNPTLQECDAGSILSGALLGESLNLSPSPQLGQYYLVPFDCKIKGPDGKNIYQRDENGAIVKDRNGRYVALSEKKAQFVLGYKGYIQLAIRSGQYTKLNVLEIKQGELISFDPLNETIECNIIDDWDAREKAPTVGYYAMFEYSNGFRKAIYWSREKMMAHADKYSPAFSKDAYQKILDGKVPESDMWKYSSFWYKNFDDMAKKTMLRQLISRWGIMSTELMSAFDHDNNIMSAQGDSILSEPEPEKTVQPTRQPEAHTAPPQIAGQPRSIDIPKPEAEGVVEAVNLADL